MVIKRPYLGGESQIGPGEEVGCRGTASSGSEILADVD